MSFEEYLEAKRIDPTGFSTAEPVLYGSWARDFERMHPNSFTMQKLNLINAVRRKYRLNAELPGDKQKESPSRPVIAKPRPKF